MLKTLHKNIIQGRRLRTALSYVESFWDYSWPFLALSGLLAMNGYIYAVHKGQQAAKAHYLTLMMNGNGTMASLFENVTQQEWISSSSSSETTGPQVDGGSGPLPIVLVVLFTILLVMFSLGLFGLWLFKKYQSQEIFTFYSNNRKSRSSNIKVNKSRKTSQQIDPETTTTERSTSHKKATPTDKSNTASLDPNTKDSDRTKSGTKTTQSKIA